MHTDSEARRASCARCGTLLSGDGAAEFCARCLLSTALKTLLVDESAEALESPLTLLARREFGNYELRSELGRGGMGIVFKARQKQPDRIVALKIVAAGELASPKALARFRLEAKTAAGLQHPNIVPIFEVGEEGGWHFFSMRWIDGPTLADVLRTEGMSHEAAVRTLLTITEAVEHAHLHGVLHRDIKPTNVLLDSAGEPHLTDFGLAKVLDQESDLTLSRAVVGTPTYMSPEQAAGCTRDITTASDVYGIGAIFYEMLTGAPPFAGETAAVLLRKVIEDDPIPPSKALKGRATPRDLEVICLKCLAKVPGRRYATAGELKADLQRWTRHEPVLARATSLGERTVKWVRRHPTRAASLATVVLALLIITIGSWIFTIRLQNARVAAEKQARANLAEVVERHIHESAGLARRADALTSLHSLAEALRISDEFPDRQSNIRLRAGLARSFSPRPIRAWDACGSPINLHFSPDGADLVVALQSAGARLLPIKTNPSGATQALFTEKNPVTGIHFSGDGRQALELLDAPPFARIRDLRTGSAILLPVAGRPGSAGSFSPDGRVIATGGTEIQFWRAQDGTRIDSPIRGNSFCEWVGFSPSGEYLVTIQTNQQAVIWNLATGKTIRILPVQRFGGYFQPTFSQDGSRMLLPDMEQAHLLDMGTFQALGKLSHPGVLFHGAFSPDASVIATASFKGGVRLWDARSLEPIQPQLNHENGARCVAFSPDGQILATGGFDYQVRLWRRSDRRQLGSALPHAALVAAIAFSPDGRFLATASADGLVRLWDIEGPGETLLTRGVADMPIVYSGDRLAFAVPETTNSWRLFRMASLTAEGVLPVSSRAVLVWDAANARIATAAPNDSIRIWETPSGRELTNYAPHGTVAGMQFSLDGKKLAVCTEKAWAGFITLDTGGQTRLPTQSEDKFFAVAWSPDSRRLVTGELGKARVWDATSVRQIGEPIERIGQVNRLQFSPDGKRIVAPFTDEFIEPRAAVMIESHTGRFIPPLLEHGDGVRDAIFSPNGQIIVTLGEDNTARLWHATTGHAAGPALRHEAMVRCAAFAPDERYLATGGNDHTLRFWEAATGEPLGPPLLFGGAVTAVGFTPDGKTVVVGVVDGSVWTLEIRSDTRLLSVINQYALVATAHKLDASGGLIRVAPEVLQHKAAQLALENGSDPLVWHRNQAVRAELSTNWFAAAFHLERLVKMNPEDAQLAARLSVAREKR